MSKESSSLQGLNGEVSYEMPRPKSFWASLFGLGLDDREIERKYVNPFEKEKEKLESKKNAQEKGESKPVPLAAKKTEQPKKEPEVTQKPQVNIAVVGDGDEGVGSEDSGVLYGGKSASRLSRTIQTRSGNESKLGGRGRGSIGSDQLRDLIKGL